MTRRVKTKEKRRRGDLTTEAMLAETEEVQRRMDRVRRPREEGTTMNRQDACREIDRAHCAWWDTLEEGRCVVCEGTFRTEQASEDEVSDLLRGGRDDHGQTPDGYMAYEIEHAQDCRLVRDLLNTTPLSRVFGIRTTVAPLPIGQADGRTVRIYEVPCRVPDPGDPPVLDAVRLR